MPVLSDSVAFATVVPFSGPLVLHNCADVAVTDLVLSAMASFKAKTGRTPRLNDHSADAMRSAPLDRVAIAQIVVASFPVTAAP